MGGKVNDENNPHQTHAIQPRLLFHHSSTINKQRSYNIQNGASFAISSSKFNDEISPRMFM
jgi:hypothetical protein